jgi:uncharacterized protein
MRPSSETITIVRMNVRIRPKAIDEFIDWQGKLYAIIARFEGFVNLEILSPTKKAKPDWVLVQRFDHPKNFSAWRESQEWHELLEELKKLIIDKPDAIKEVESEVCHEDGHVTEVFVTQVNADMENAYREWIARIHQVEAKFPGFRGVYVQAPRQGKGKNWITLLQFDTPSNLDRWLSSPEREEVLRESEPLIASLENHRVISPYAGWFASIAKNGELPAVWKQTMIVLLVLFPIVMLELKFLPFITGNLNLSLATFIGNAISVSLIAWPMMPIAIWFLGWWLSPKKSSPRLAILGMFVLLGLYLIEIFVFWTY